MLTGHYHPDREPWVIHVHRLYTAFGFTREVVWTPPAPGPLNGTWAFTHGPLHECRYGELGLDSDPGWPPNTRLLVIWEQPDTSQQPDFVGTAGIVRGARSELGGKYTLPVLGLGDIDAQGLAGQYTRVGHWADDTITAYGVELDPPKATENVQAHLARLLEPHPDGGWGVRPDGRRVVGRPSATTPVLVPARDVLGLQGSGYERQEYVTETVGHPGERWGALTQTRPRPTVLTPRVLALAATDNLVLPNTEFVARLNFVQLISRRVDQAEEAVEATYTQEDFGGLRPEKEVYLALPPSAQHTGDGVAPRPRVRVKARFSVPLSQIVRESASSRHAQAARWALDKLVFPLRAWVTSPAGSLPGAPYEAYEQTEDTAQDYGTLYLRDWLSAAPDGRWEDALTHLSNGERPLTGASQLELRLSPPDDLMGEVYESIGGGTYHYLLEVWVELAARHVVFRRRPGIDPSNAAYVYGFYGDTAHLEVGRPTALADALADALPTANLPDGWDAPPYSDPTHQGRVPGRLIAPARLTGLRLPNGAVVDQDVTELRRVRTPQEYHTSVQTAARQTRKLTAAETHLKTAKEGRAW